MYTKQADEVRAKAGRRKPKVIKNFKKLQKKFEKGIDKGRER